MSDRYEIYCDESCHLNNSLIPVMGFAGIRIPFSKKEKVYASIAKLKSKYNCNGELKWTKVSEKNIAFYRAIIDFFCKTKGLEFHSVIIQDKSKLDHEKYNKGKDEIFYYKMYFLLLKNIISRKSDAAYRIFMDIKRKHAALEVNQLKQFLSSKLYSETDSNIKKIQTCSSGDVSLIQLTDFLLGALMYANRFEDRNSSKGKIVSYLEEQLDISLKEKTSYSQNKYHIFVFTPETDSGVTK